MTEESNHLSKRLSSNNIELVRKTVDQLRKKGSRTDILEIIQGLLLQTNPKARELLVRLLSDINNADLVQPIISAIQSNPQEHAIKDLVRISWESNQDFSDYLIVFADILLTQDYAVAIEAFTVVETHCLDRTISKEIKDQIRLRINNLIHDQDEDKKRLCTELLVILD